MKKVALHLLLMVLLVGLALSQERWLLRFTPKQGLILNWQIRMTTKMVVNKRATTEMTEMTVRESVDDIRPNGNLVWSSKVLRCVINGQVVPSTELETSVAELTPSGQPVTPIVLPPPTLDGLDDWLTELFGGVTLIFPTAEVHIGETWTQSFSVGLKSPNEPRSLRITYRLDGWENIGKVECFRIVVRTEAPVKLLWQTVNITVTVTGGAKLDGVFWFDPKLGAVRQRRVVLSSGYTLETDRWDGIQFVQTTKFVNQTTNLEAKLISP